MKDVDVEEASKMFANVFPTRKWALTLMGFAFLGLFLVACGGAPAPEPTPTPPPDPPAPVTFSISGVVHNFGGSPVAGVVVAANGEAVTTGSDGKWELSGFTDLVTVSASFTAGVVCPFAFEVPAAASGLVFTAHEDSGGHAGMAGAGLSTDPFVITNIDQLQAVDSDLTAHYVLCDNIDASGKTDFTPIGAGSSDFFEGSLDGRNHEVHGLVIDLPSEESVGLFAQLAVDSVVQNLGFVGGSVTGDRTVGALAGVNSGEINNVYNTSSVGGVHSGMDEGVGGIVGVNDGVIMHVKNGGQVTGIDDVGGIAGTNFGVVEDAVNIGAVQGVEYVGGIAGYSSDTTLQTVHNSGAIVGSMLVGGIAGAMDNNTIRDGYNEGEVNGDEFVGGIAGQLGEYSLIEQAVNIGDVFASDALVGGIVGENLGEIKLSYNSGLISAGNQYAGGVAGMNSGEIENSYNMGRVSGASTDVGGIAGRHDSGGIVNTYNVGEISGTSTTDIGGIAGGDDGSSGTITSSYFDATKVANDSGFPGSTAVTEAALQTESTFAGWDFGAVWSIAPGEFPDLLDNPRP